MGLIQDILNRQAIIVLDSAMGTELKARGADISSPLWSARALYEKPDTVRQIHIDNIDAGADIVTANTFRTQKRTMEKAGYMHNGLGFSESARELTTLAVEIAKDAVMITRDEVLVAGSIATLEDCYKPELAPDTDTLCTEQNEHILNLIDGGADILLPETMNNVREISAVLNQIHKTGKEFIISMICRSSSELLSGEQIKDAVKIIEKFSPSAIMVNCVHPALAGGVITTLKSLTPSPVGVYANVGIAGCETADRLEVAVSAAEYFDYAVKWKKIGAVLIGGCCGTNPDYIRKLSILKN